MSWTRKALRWGGTCRACGGVIAPHEVGWHEPDLKAIRCNACGPEDLGKTGTDISEQFDSRSTSDPVGGTSALRDGRTRRDPLFKKGAVGEYLADKYFQEHLPPQTPILTDRRVPGTQSNIDHIVIVPSGVWIIDSKRWNGKIEYKTRGALSLDYRLSVGGEDRTEKVEKFYELVIPVAQVIRDKSIPINAAFCFIQGNWSFSDAIMLNLGKLNRHLDVWLGTRATLVKLMKKSGPMTPETITSLGDRLNREFTPR
jgi:hypothetical protein